ncbi:MAG: DLW-39 family protein [Dermatophilaceae bacterium]
MLKRLALIAGSLFGLSLLRKKARQQQAEQDLWSQATDDVPAPFTPAPAPPAPAADSPVTPTES